MFICLSHSFQATLQSKDHFVESRLVLKRPQLKFERSGCTCRSTDGYKATGKILQSNASWYKNNSSKMFTSHPPKRPRTVKSKSRVWRRWTSWACCFRCISCRTVRSQELNLQSIKCDALKCLNASLLHCRFVIRVFLEALEACEGFLCTLICSLLESCPFSQSVTRLDSSKRTDIQTTM